MKYCTRNILCISLLLIAMTGIAQTSKTDPVDMQARLGAGLQLDLPKKWEADMEYQLRLNDNATSYRGHYFSAGMGYNFSKKIKAFVNYRFAITNKGNSNRYGFGAEYTEKFNKWSVSLRPMIQYTKKIVDDDETSGEEHWLLRTRLLVKYRVAKKLDVYGSVEPYFTFNEDYPVDNWRNTIGFKYEYAKNKKIDLYYIYRPDYAKSYNRTFHIIGLNLDFSLKAKKKEGKK